MQVTSLENFTCLLSALVFFFVAVFRFVFWRASWEGEAKGCDRQEVSRLDYESGRDDPCSGGGGTLRQADCRIRYPGGDCYEHAC